ncbi:MAG: DUF4384 domain-containing protein [Treponema sp.]|nr:DUF4384 domain-containing protein [Treponema sp.]
MGEVPQSETEFFFVGTSQPYDTAANARDDARENARNQVLKFYGEFIESRAIARSGISGSTRDTLESFVNREDQIKNFAQHVVTEVGTVRYYTEVWLTGDNKEEHVAYTLCRIPRQRAEEDIANFAGNISARYTNLLPQSTTLKAALEGYALVVKALEQNPLHRITAYHESPDGRTGLFEYARIRISELANSLSVEPVPARTIQETETLNTPIRLRSSILPATGLLDCRANLFGAGGNITYPFNTAGDDPYNLQIRNLKPGAYTVQIEILLSELTGGMAKNTGAGFTFEVSPLNVVLTTPEAMEAGVKRAVDALAAGLEARTETLIGPFTLTGTDVPTGLSVYLAEKVSHYAKNNRDRKYRVVVGSGDKRAALTGFFTRRNDRVDVTLELSTPEGGAGSQIFSLSAAELARWGIAVEPENPEARDDLDAVLAALAGAGETGGQSPAARGIHIQAWFDSESRTYMHRDPLKMTVTADRDCYFKIIHIDVNNRMKMIYPNSYDKNNYLRANVPRPVFESAAYMLYEPYGTETILIAASADQFKGIEEEFAAPWTACTAESLREAIGGSRGGDIEARPILFTGEGEARYSITILKPHEEYEYARPEDMAAAVQTMREGIVPQGGFFEGSETSGYGVLNKVRTSYRVSRDRPDTVRFAVYYLDSFSGGPGPRTRGQGFSFSFARPGDLSRALEAVRSGIERKGGTFNGNERQGSFRAGGIAGQYRVAEVVQVTISEKPPLIPKTLIEKEVKNYFGGS